VKQRLKNWTYRLLGKDRQAAVVTSSPAILNCAAA
jgi:hypothetical protein